MKKESYYLRIKEIYPKAIIKNISCKKGNYFEVYSEENGLKLGKSKSKRGAWASSFKNINN